MTVSYIISFVTINKIIVTPPSSVIVSTTAAEKSSALASNGTDDCAGDAQKALPGLPLRRCS
jgi:hypothetical protein